jgi:gamma-glutamylcyclotransferase (GGCT)/AIG2-like uncharacterized protein YtfP
MTVPAEQLPVFVYGTLRPGQKNYPRYLQGRTLREHSATIRGLLYFVPDGGYPYLRPGEGTVSGELLELDPESYDETLYELDLLEEYDPQDEERSVYLRRKTTVTLSQGEQVTAWAYYWNVAKITGEKIESGDFSDRSG